MKFEVTRDVENRVFSVSVAFKGYGNEDKGISAEQEVEMFKDYGYPKVEVGSTFTGDIEFILPSKTMEVKDGFVVSYSASVDRMSGETEEEKIAEARSRCELFESTIETRLAEAIAKVPVDMASSFTQDHPEELVF